MRKKKLIEQNLSLFEDLQKTRYELSNLKKELNKNNEIILSLKSQLENNNPTPNPASVVETSAPKLEEKVESEVKLKPDMEYGAKIIGKLVLVAAKYSDKLTICGAGDKKELLNLILGKTEVAKAEILAVIETNDSFEVKRDKINKISEVTNEYYASVLAQIS